MSQSEPKSGFSLAEVIVAFAILAIALLAIFQSFGLVARGAAASERERTALAFARSLLATAGVSEPLHPHVETGKLPGGIAWSRTTAPVESKSSAGLPRPYQVTIRLTWERGFGRPGELTISTIKLAATQ